MKILFYLFKKKQIILDFLSSTMSNNVINEAVEVGGTVEVKAAETQEKIDECK